MPSPKKIYGLIGYPVKHSLSAAMHNAAFKKAGINAEYRLFEVKPQELEGFLEGKITVNDSDGNFIHSKNIEGFNITIPHKVKAREILERSNFAEFDSEYLSYIRIAGAINTARRRENSKLIVSNTDGLGFVESLDKDLGLKLEDIYGRKVFIIGCGGAGRAVVAGLAWEEGLGDDSKIGKIYLYDKSYEALELACAQFANFLNKDDKKIEFISDKNKIPEIIKNCRLLVNASPIGMEKDDDRTVIDKNLLHKGLSIYDVVYNRKTQLIKDAESLKLPAKGGLGMLLYQGVLAWEFWTGQKPDIEEMKKALKQELIKRC